jgi:hypothetical protein
VLKPENILHLLSHASLPLMMCISQHANMLKNNFYN